MPTIKFAPFFTAFVLFFVSQKEISAQNLRDTTPIFINYGGLFKNGYYLKSGTKYPLGFNFSNLDKEFKDFPKAHALFVKGKKKEGWSKALETVGSLATIAGIIHIENQLSKDKINRNQIEWGLTGIFAGMLIEFAWSVPLSKRARNHINEAVYWRGLGY